MSGSRCCSRKAENSTRRSLCVAMARPSHGGGGAGGVRPAEVATVVGAGAAVDAAGAVVVALGVADAVNRATSPPVLLPFDAPLADLLFADGLAPT